MKEEDAKKKVCPELSHIRPPYYDYDTGVGYPPEYLQVNCLGSDCAMWDSWESWEERGFHDSETPTPEWTKTDRTKRAIMNPREKIAIWHRPLHKGEGDCGLKSQPLQCNGM